MERDKRAGRSDLPPEGGIKRWFFPREDGFASGSLFSRTEEFAWLT